MSVITIFNGVYCGAEEILDELAKTTEFEKIDDAQVAALAAEMSGISVEKIMKAFSARTSVFDRFTHEKENRKAWLRLAVAELMKKDDFLLVGFSGHLIPPEISHVLKVCIIADLNHRLNMAQQQGLSEKEANASLRRNDEDATVWVQTLTRIRDPWDPSLYDILLPGDKVSVAEAVKLVVDNLRLEVIHPTESSQKAARDFELAARVGIELVKHGHAVDVRARDGAITLTINEHVMFLQRLQDELVQIASKVDGVVSVETRVGKGYHKADIYRRADFEMPSRVLLVDDEREFVQTLSERLMMREMGSAIAYDGESALDVVKDDQPDVMILDLKMPGIDGIEVLKRVKETHPQIEVIILTGHGSEKDRHRCMQLGAFAYLNKPVDIELLSDMIKKANAKIAQASGSDSHPSG